MLVFGKQNDFNTFLVCFAMTIDHGETTPFDCFWPCLEKRIDDAIP